MLSFKSTLPSLKLPFFAGAFQIPSAPAAQQKQYTPFVKIKLLIFI
jgi:hypothetical protein